MNPKNAVLFLLLGLILITILHTVGVIASRKFNVKTTWLNVFLFGVYILIGYLNCRYYGFDTALFVNALLATYEATIGVRLPFIFKIEKSTGQPAKPVSIKAVIFMIGVAGIFTVIGYLLSTF